MSLLDKIKHRLDDTVESGKRLSENTSDFAAAADAFHKFSPLLSFIDRYLPPLAIITSGFALIFEAVDVSIKRRIDRFLASKMGLGLTIVAAGILGLVFPVIAAAMFAVVVTAGLGKQIVEFVKHLNEEAVHDPAVVMEKRLELTAGSIAWAGAMLLIIGGPFFPPLAIAGFGLLMLSIALPAANKLWHWLHKADEINESATQEVSSELPHQHEYDSVRAFEIAEAKSQKSQEAHKTTDASHVNHNAFEGVQPDLEHIKQNESTAQGVSSELSHQHEYDSTARASLEIAEAESKELHEPLDEEHVKHKAVEEIKQGLEHPVETLEVEPSPVITESVVMPLDSKPVKKPQSKDEAGDSEGEGGEITPKM